MDGDAEALAADNALRKAQAVHRPGTPELVLGVDTIVTLDGAVYGKADDERAAAAMLRTLSGRTHTVISGLALLGDDRRQVTTAATDVTFRDLDEPMLEWYLGTAEWRERAGSYAIQGAGAALVRRVEGDYENVVGLPLAALLDLCPELVARA
jgi:septum formation protein